MIEGEVLLVDWARDKDGEPPVATLWVVEGVVGCGAGGGGSSTDIGSLDPE